VDLPAYSRLFPEKAWLLANGLGQDECEQPRFGLLDEYRVFLA
jgi:hypothetical protein